MFKYLWISFHSFQQYFCKYCMHAILFITKSPVKSGRSYSKEKRNSLHIKLNIMHTFNKFSDKAARFYMWKGAFWEPVKAAKSFQKSTMQKNRANVLTAADLAWVCCKYLILWSPRNHRHQLIHMQTMIDLRGIRLRHTIHS